MPYCDRCDRSFNSWNALEQHQDNSGAHNRCNKCDRDFTTLEGLKSHRANSRFHFYCKSCEEDIDDEDELDDHYEDDHYWCSDCRLLFDSSHKLNEHYRQSSEHPYCDQCRRRFVSYNGLNDHYRQSPNHNYCADCKRHFSSDNDLRNHLNSSVHVEANVRCSGKGCKKTFISPSAMLLHLESGQCCSGVTRALVNKKVRDIDTQNIITNPSRLLTGGSDPYHEVTYFATRRAWNGSAYECYLCHGTYKSLESLNQHLASPRHEEKVYICPLNTCRKEFTTLSGLCQHIESEQCGVHRFKAVRKTIDSVVGQMKRLAL